MASKLSALEKFAYKKKEKRPTGIDCFDTITKDGPEQGDLIALASKQGGGKSTMLLQLAKNYIEQYNMKVAYLDVERGVKQEILENMGLLQYMESGDFFISNRASTYEDAQEILDDILASKDNWGLLVIDSITALVPKKLISADLEDTQMAVKARAMTAFIDKYRGALANRDIITFMVVQYRKNLKQQFAGAPEYNTAAPMTLNHAADVVLHITVSQAKDRKIFTNAEVALGVQQTAIGAIHYLWAEKNKHAVPGIKVNFPVIYGQEISNIEYLKHLIFDKKLYTKQNASWYSSIGGMECKINGKAAAEKFILDNAEALREQLFLKGHYDLIGMQGILDVKEDSEGIAIEDLLDEN